MLPKDVNDSDYYEFSYWPKNGTLDSMDGCKLEALDDDAVEAFEKIYDNMWKKGTVTTASKVSLKCTRILRGQGKGAHFVVDDARILIQYHNTGKKKSLQFTRIKDADSHHLLLAIKLFKYLIDGIMEKSFTGAKYASLFRSASFIERLKKKEFCINCGVNFKTMAGSKLHKCSVVNGILKEYDCQLCDESFACESRRQKHELNAHGIDGRTWSCNDCDEDFLNEDDFRLHNNQKHGILPSKKIRENQDQKPSGGTEDMDIEYFRNTSANGMKRLAAKKPMPVVDLINEEWPGRIIINVKADGTCVARAISVTLWKSENHWIPLAKATNEAIIQRWDNVKDHITFPLETRVGGTEIRFENVNQYHEFLKTEEASWIWRDSHDLMIMSDLLGLRIVVIAAKDDVAVGWHEFVPTSLGQVPDDNRIVLLCESSHYKAIAPPMAEIVKDELRLKELAKFVYEKRSQAQNPCVPNIPAIPENSSYGSGNDMLRRLEELERTVARMCAKTHDLEGTCQSQKEKIEKLEAKVIDNDRANAELEQRHQARIEKMEELKRELEKKVVNLGTNLPTRSKNVIDKKATVDLSDKSAEEKKRELEEAMALFVFKNQGSDRVSPQAAPQQKSPQAECDKCSIIFSTKDNLKKHTDFYHPATNNIPVVTSQRENTATSKPSGVVHRQYNCRECPFQGSKSKDLYKHSQEARHFDIDSLEERCYTCHEQFENYSALMKHRKMAHPQTINECHYYKSGQCKFQDRCFYRHSGENEKRIYNNDTRDTRNHSFHRGQTEFPPDISALTEKLRDLMTFLSQEEKQTRKLPGQ